jgi:hypothetical protein
MLAYFKPALLTVAWTGGSAILATLIMSVPTFVEGVDAYRWGRASVKVLFATLPLLFLGGLLFTYKRRRAAVGLTAPVLAACIAVDIYVLLLVSRA